MQQSRLFKAFAVIAALNFVTGDSNSKTWNEKIDWFPGKDWEAALEIAHKGQKPLMLLIHRVWCGACKALRPKFEASQEIEALSASFVMVQSHEDSEFTENTFKPDGGYVPRVLFFDPEGHLIEDAQRAGAEKHRYFHFEAKSIAETMAKVARDYLIVPDEDTNTVDSNEEMKLEL